MKAVMYYGPREIRLVDVPLPKPGAGEMLIKVGAALTCGTDFKAYRQGHPVLLRHLPSPFGHELAGTVVEIGAGVVRFKPGDRVVAANSAPCDACFFCLRGQNQLCDDLKLHNGAYAEYNLLPASIVKHNVYNLGPGDNFSFSDAAMAEPLSCAIHAADVLKVQPGETVALIGSGTMSLLLIHALAELGARILVAGRDRANLDRALAAGADEAFSALDGNPVAAVRSACGGRGPDSVIEAVGRPETWRQALSMVRKGGRVCLFGGCAPGTEVPVDAHKVHYGQVSLLGVFHHTPRYFAAAVKLLRQRRVRTDLLISDEIELDEVPAFFERMHDQSNAKVAVIP